MSAAGPCQRTNGLDHDALTGIHESSNLISGDLLPFDCLQHY
jgi:hypothetical protein